MGKKIFICQIVPPRNVHQLKYISQAANNFCINLIKAYKPDIVFSVIPVFITKKSSFNFDLESQVIPIQKRFLNFRMGSKLINILLENISLIWNIIKLSNTHSKIWFYNLSSYHYVLSYLISKIILRRQCYFIIADFRDSNNKFRWLSKLITFSNGILSFSENINKVIKHRNTVIHPGVINDPPTNFYKENNQKKIFLFSGRLDDRTGIKLAVSVFSQHPEIQLVISGEGQHSEFVIKECAKYSNIKYLGYLNYEKYLEILKQSTFCLSLRNPNYSENIYNFPSKILEYMAWGKIVISTMEYSTVDGRFIYYTGYNEENLYNRINELFSLTQIELNKLQMKISNYALEYFGYDQLVKKMQSVENNGVEKRIEIL